MKKAGFGQKGCISAQTLLTLPTPMLVDGLLLLAEMGHTQTEIADISGLSRATVRRLMSEKIVPYSLLDRWSALGAKEVEQ